MHRRWRQPLICGAIVGIVSSVMVPVAISILSTANDLPTYVLITRGTQHKVWLYDDSAKITHHRADFHWATSHYSASSGPPNFATPHTPGTVPAWMPRPDQDNDIHACAVGFPMRSLYGWTLVPRSMVLGCRTGLPDRRPPLFASGWIQLASFENQIRPISVEFPYLPIWSGLIINALTHAAAWSALFLGLAQLFPSARRARRTRRGLCPACAYDLRRELAAGCPECGWKRSLSREPEPAQR